MLTDRYLTTLDDVGTGVWIGLSDKDQEGTWLWDSGKKNITNIERRGGGGRETDRQDRQADRTDNQKKQAKIPITWGEKEIILSLIFCLFVCGENLNNLFS